MQRRLKVPFIGFVVALALLMASALLMSLFDDDEKKPARPAPAPASSKPPISDADFARGVRTAYAALSGSDAVVLNAMTDEILAGEGRAACNQLLRLTPEQTVIDELVARHGRGAPSAQNELFFLVEQSVTSLCPDVVHLRAT